MGIYPFDHTVFDDAKAVVTNLASYDRDKWAEAFSAVAVRYEEAGLQAENNCAGDEAKANFLHAYSFYRMARFPTTNSDGKLTAYRKSQELFLKAARYFEVPVEQVEMPFHGREGEGDRVIAYMRVPTSAEPLPLLLVSGGIDTFKEDSQEEDVLEQGIATLSIDIPGVGDAPVVGSIDAERLWDAIFDWVGTRHEIDPRRVGYWGSSTGGYWAVKVAHTHRDHLAAVVSQGGCVHHAFESEWIEKAQLGDYPFELAETLAFAFGRSTFEEWVEYAPQLSLLRQGILDQPCAPLLLVNGLHDSVFPIQDYYLMLEHGDPKTARFFDAPHMGYTRDTRSIILNWLTQLLKTSMR